MKACEAFRKTSWASGWVKVFYMRWEYIKCISSRPAWKGSCAVREGVTGGGNNQEMPSDPGQQLTEAAGWAEISSAKFPVLIGCFGEIQVGEGGEDDSGRAEWWVRNWPATSDVVRQVWAAAGSDTPQGSGSAGLCKAKPAEENK